jgi:hypothetical protein
MSHDRAGWRERQAQGIKSDRAPGGQPGARDVGKVRDLKGQVFGQLTVTMYAGRDRDHGHALWCCRCACLPGCHDCQGKGCSIKIRGTKLICGKAFSCGCSRTDPEFRRKMALKLPVAIRKARAQKAAEKCRGVKRNPSYALSLTEAGRRLGITSQAVAEMSRAGILRTTYRAGQIKVSAADVADYLAGHAGESAKRCPLDPRTEEK